MEQSKNSKYMGITHFTFWGWLPEWVYSLWKILFCSNEMHLFDEVLSSDDDHYLYCDACGLSVEIKSREKELEEDGWCNKVDWP
jgi:hypothetical protein